MVLKVTSRGAYIYVYTFENGIELGTREQKEKANIGHIIAEHKERRRELLSELTKPKED